MTTSSSSSSSTNDRHDILKAYPRFWASLGVMQTLLSAGIVFGWASLLPILRNEGVDNTPQQFSKIFTCGAIGNYLSTLLFGVTLDRFGPRVTAIMASLLFAVGLILCIFQDSFYCLSVGFGLLGFAGPGIQMPTLHFANLFSSAGGAFYMSSQAAAFDGGTLVFAVVRYFHISMSLTTADFFRVFLIVPGSVLLTAIFVWPDVALDNPETVEQELDAKLESPYLGPASSPYLSPRVKPMIKKKKKANANANANAQSTTEGGDNAEQSLINAPLEVVFRHQSFWTLAIWVSVHILKLNFVVATLNDQLYNTVDSDTKDRMIDLFGAMLPFGFIALPLVAWLLNKSPIWVIQIANVVGVAYGAILVWYPSSTWLLSFVVFPAVATSRQMVYSTVFHQIGAVFGFANYGVLLGSTNILVSLISAIQTPLVSLSEDLGDYTTANYVLLLLTVPLFFVGLVQFPGSKKKKSTTRSDSKTSEEEATLLGGDRSGMPRNYSTTSTGA
ncbi:unnamed protein product [Cylindrotheca closterium]|uniref:MFS general substrate transporter n=1 Tax=Cylindrotheca closterium TaxID=2856 RepID=A0AAD2CQZ5_9STRA|nr:unnamed protein product [Cylindrotheca closterium]